MELQKLVQQGIDHLVRKWRSDLDDSYRSSKDFDTRWVESTRIKVKYPECIPVILIPQKRLGLQKKKYLVPRDTTVGFFIHDVQKRVTTGSSDQALFFFHLNGNIPVTSELISTCYRWQKDPDGFLYFQVTAEEVYG